MQRMRLIGLAAVVIGAGLSHYTAYGAPGKPAPASASTAPIRGAATTLPSAIPSLHWPGGADHITIPLIRAGDLLLAPLRINGHEAGPCLIDTTFPTTTLDRELVKQIGLPTIAAAPLRVGEQPAGDYVEATDVSVGPAAAQEISQRPTGLPAFASGGRRVLLAADLKPVLAQGLKIAGIIGNDLLKLQPVTIDFRADTITFYDPARFMSAFPPAAIPPTTAPAGGLTTVSIVGGSSVTTGKLRVHSGGAFPMVAGKVRGHDGVFLIETAATGAMTLYGPFLSLHRDITDGYHPIPSGGASAGTDPIARASDSAPINDVEILGRPPTQIFAAFSVPGRPAANGFEVTCAGSIGAALLRDTRITLDYAGERVWVTPLPEETAEQMLARLGDVAGRDLVGQTALSRAVIAGRADVVKILLERGADPNVATTSDVTSLMLAARDGRDAIVTLLLAKGAKPDTKAAVGATTALLEACCTGQASVVRALLAGKADPKLADMRGSTPLHRAAESGSLPCLQALLAAGADVNAKTNENLTVLMAASIAGDQAAIGAALKAGADVNAIGPNGWTALILASAAGAPIETLAALLDGGAKPNIADDAGRTSLMMVAQRGDERAARLLLARGADANIKNIGGRTARDFAADAPQADVVQLLLPPPKP